MKLDAFQFSSTFNLRLTDPCGGPQNLTHSERKNVDTDWLYSTHKASDLCPGNWENQSWEAEVADMLSSSVVSDVGG